MQTIEATNIERFMLECRLGFFDLMPSLMFSDFVQVISKLRRHCCLFCFLPNFQLFVAIFYCHSIIRDLILSTFCLLGPNLCLSFSVSPILLEICRVHESFATILLFCSYYLLFSFFSSSWRFSNSLCSNFTDPSCELVMECMGGNSLSSSTSYSNNGVE